MLVWNHLFAWQRPQTNYDGDDHDDAHSLELNNSSTSLSFGCARSLARSCVYVDAMLYPLVGCVIYSHSERQTRSRLALTKSPDTRIMRSTCTRTPTWNALICVCVWRLWRPLRARYNHRNCGNCGALACCLPKTALARRPRSLFSRYTGAPARQQRVNEPKTIAS